MTGFDLLGGAALSVGQGDMDASVLGGGGEHRQFDGVQGGAHVAVCDAGDMAQGVFVRPDVQLAKAPFPVRDGAAQGLFHIFLGQRLKSEHPAPAHDGGGHGNHGVFGGGADKADQAAFHGGQDGIGLGLAPAVTFVQQKIGGLAIQGPPVRRLFQFLPHVRNAAGHSVQLDESGVGLPGDDARQGGFAAARRAVKNAGGETVRLDGPPQQPPGAHDMLLPEKLVQRPGTHPVRQGRAGFFIVFKQRHARSSATSAMMRFPSSQRRVWGVSPTPRVICRAAMP